MTIKPTKAANVNAINLFILIGFGVFYLAALLFDLSEKGLLLYVANEEYFEFCLNSYDGDDDDDIQQV